MTIDVAFWEKWFFKNHLKKKNLTNCAIQCDFFFKEKDILPMLDLFGILAFLDLILNWIMYF